MLRYTLSQQPDPMLLLVHRTMHMLGEGPGIHIWLEVIALVKYSHCDIIQLSLQASAYLSLKNDLQTFPIGLIDCTIRQAKRRISKQALMFPLAKFEICSRIHPSHYSKLVHIYGLLASI